MEDNLGIPLIGIFMLFMKEEAFRDVLLRTFGNQLLLHELSCVVFGRLIEDPYDGQGCLRSVCVVAFTVCLLCICTGEWVVNSRHFVAQAIQILC